ncbi:MAG: 3-oxoadipate enol-lactonase [Pseudomonadota bacterium]
MRVVKRDQILLHVREDGDPDGKPVVFVNSLGTDFRLWDAVLPWLPTGMRFVRFDKRGHGLSTCPGNSWTLDDLIDDTVEVLRALHIDRCFFVGLSIGGLIGQGLAARHPEHLHAMVISNTAARIGTAEMWQQRVEAVQSGGIEALADAVMERWFSHHFRTQRTDELQLWRNMLTRTPDDGYIGCSRAIAGADFTSTNPALDMPVLAIGGDEDGSTPPKLMRETVAGIPDCRFALIESAGHLPCVEHPKHYAQLLADFMHKTGWADGT